MKKHLLQVILILAVIAIGVRTIITSRQTTSTPVISENRTLITKATYICDANRAIIAAYYEGQLVSQPKIGEPPVPTGSVGISLDGGAIIALNQTISASGIRYANKDESFVFWNKGETALVMRNNSVDLNYTNCIQAKEPIFKWRYEEFEGEYFFKSRIFLDVTYPNGAIDTKLIDTIDGGCADAPEQNEAVAPHSTKILCYYAGLGHYFKVIKGGNSYLVQRKIFEEATPDYTPPVQKYETVAKFNFLPQ